MEDKRGAPAYTITMLEFLDADTFVNLDSLVVREKPRWCFLNPRLGAQERQKIEDILARSAVGVAAPVGADGSAFRWPKDPSKRGEVEAELARALDEADLRGHAEILSLAPPALNSLMCLLSELRPLGFLEAGSHPSLNTYDGDSNAPSTAHELILGRLDSCMRLDSAAADAIMLLPDKTAPSSPHSSLFGVLNQCKTVMGSRLLESWLRQPLVERAAIEARHDLVAAFKDDVALRGDLIDALKHAPDLELLVSRLRRFSMGSKGRLAALGDVYKLYCFALKSLPGFKAAIDASTGEQGPDGVGRVLAERFGSPLRQCDTDLDALKALVEHVIDFDALPEMRIQAKHSPELASLEEESSRAMAELQEIHQTVQEEWSGVKSSIIRLEPHKEEGWIMRLPSASDEQTLRKEIPGVKILAILKSGCTFTTDELRSAAAECVAIKGRYDEEQKAVADKVVATAATYVPVVECCARLVGQNATLVLNTAVSQPCVHAPGGRARCASILRSCRGALPYRRLCSPSFCRRR